MFHRICIRARARLPLAAACLAAFLSGCATVKTASDPTRSPPKVGESVVAVSITGNTAQVTALDTITVHRTDPQPAGSPRAVYILHQVAPGLSRDTALFIGVMPEGQYEFETFSNQQTRRSLTLREEMRQAIGHFAVASGRAVDLGRLIVTPVNTNVVVGRSQRVTSNLPLMHRFATEQSHYFDGQVASGWIDGRGKDDEVEGYALARPVGADVPVEWPDGRVAAGSRLGSVLIRSTEGRWRVVGSDVLESVLYVMPVSRADAQLIAVGEMGTLLRLPPDGRRLVPIEAGNLPRGNLFFIDGSDAAGWYVAMQSGTEMSLYRSDRLESGDWKLQFTESVARDFFNGNNNAWFWAEPGGIGFAASSGTLRFLDFTTGRWTTAAAPNNNRLTAVSPNPDGSLGILTSPGGGFGGVFASLYLTSDRGATWQEIKPDFKVNIAPPIRTLDGTVFVLGGVFSKRELHASSDGGLTWQNRGDFPASHRLVALPTKGLLSISLGQFGLFSIEHAGSDVAKWDIEYSNFDRAAYDHQKKP